MHQAIKFGLALAVLATAPAMAQVVDPAKEAAFLVANAKVPGVHVMPGLQYKILKSGPASGQRPVRTSAVKVSYEGRDISGKVFDTTAGKGDGTIIFALKMMVPGFQVPLLYMRPGDEWEVYVPAELGYAHGGSPRSNQTLIFKITLHDWAEIPAAQQVSPILAALRGK